LIIKRGGPFANHVITTSISIKNEKVEEVDDDIPAVPSPPQSSMPVLHVNIGMMVLLSPLLGHSPPRQERIN
jgi:hypothetical protein